MRKALGAKNFMAMQANFNKKSGLSFWTTSFWQLHWELCLVILLFQLQYQLMQ